MKWQDELKNSIRKPEQLVAMGAIRLEDLENIKNIQTEFPFSITPYYAKLINWDNPKDPLLLSVLPTVNEIDRIGSLDVSGESVNTKEEGVQVKYPSTALILAIPACFSYCRFCFRKRLFNPEVKGDEIMKNLDSVAAFLQDQKQIDNILITGGDPLMIKTPQLRKFLTKIRKIDNIKIIRFGTRALSFLPSRILSDPSLLDLFKEMSHYNKRVYIINHFNHPNELTKDVGVAVDKLMEAGVVLANQSVMLKNVNDSPTTLNKLFNNLAEWGITPYYHFQCRFVKAATHFRVPLYKTYDIVSQARNGLNGPAKRIRLIMAHFTGKIEILGVQMENNKRIIYLKYQHALDKSHHDKVYSFLLPDDAYWLDDIPEAKFLFSSVNK